ncbi:MAG: hypothetical protein IPK52_04190 [Chloroflexi bacterium]|nr:hypothetical protein [Chloroflexota bacterium]
MIHLIYCSARDTEWASIAIEAGWHYGAQLPNAAHFAPDFVDQDWNNPVRAQYLAALRENRPRWATVLDLERRDQLAEVLGWAETPPRRAGPVIIIPKAFGVIGLLPSVIGGRQVVLGYSVRTAFGGTTVPYHEFGHRPVHLLGGSPRAQFQAARFLNVVSADGSWARKIANKFAEGITTTFQRKATRPTRGVFYFLSLYS